MIPSPFCNCDDLAPRRRGTSSFFLFFFSISTFPPSGAISGSKISFIVFFGSFNGYFPYVVSSVAALTPGFSRSSTRFCSHFLERGHPSWFGRRPPFSSVSASSRPVTQTVPHLLMSLPPPQRASPLPSASSIDRAIELFSPFPLIHRELPNNYSF